MMGDPLTRGDRTGGEERGRRRRKIFANGRALKALKEVLADLKSDVLIGAFRKLIKYSRELFY